jgi:uridine phosphorylase
MGGPSAAIVLADLAKLGVRRAVRVGTCTGFAGRTDLGELLLPAEAVAVAGSAASFGLDPGASAVPDRLLFERLQAELEAESRTVAVASLDTLPKEADSPKGVAAADLQTVAVLARSRELEIAAAAALIVSELAGERLDDEALERASLRLGRAAANVLSNPQVEG